MADDNSQCNALSLSLPILFLGGNLITAIRSRYYIARQFSKHRNERHSDSIRDSEGRGGGQGNHNDWLLARNHQASDAWEAKKIDQITVWETWKKRKKSNSPSISHVERVFWSNNAAWENLRKRLAQLAELPLNATTNEADLVRVEGLKTPTPPPAANTAWSSGAPMGAICSLLQYN